MGFIENSRSQRHHDLEDRLARLAFEFDGAMVLLDEGLREREAKPLTAFAA